MNTNKVLNKNQTDEPVVSDELINWLDERFTLSAFRSVATQDALIRLQGSHDVLDHLKAINKRQ